MTFRKIVFALKLLRKIQAFMMALILYSEAWNISVCLRSFVVLKRWRSRNKSLFATSHYSFVLLSTDIANSTLFAISVDKYIATLESEMLAMYVDMMGGIYWRLVEHCWTDDKDEKLRKQIIERT